MSAVATVLLKEVASFIRGITFKPDDVVQVGSDRSVACMRTKNVQSQLDMSDVWGVPESLVRRDDQFLVAGDILVSSANSWNLVGKCCWIPELPWRATFGGFISVLRGNSAKIDPRYLYHWFSSPRVQSTVRSFGQQTTNISNLNIDRCLRLPLPLPLLPVQRRIAEVLDKADALRTKRRTALARLGILTQSIFLDMFGDPAMNPKGICKQPLGELLKLKSGEFLPAAEMVKSGKYAVLGGNGISGFHDEYKFEEPQIVIGRVGAYCGCVHVSPPKSWVTDNALYVSARHPDVLFGYLVHALTHAHLNQYASKFGQPLVSGSRIYPVQILVPPKEEQKEFVARATHAQELKCAHEASQNQFDALFSSLQYRAFQGEV